MRGGAGCGRGSEQWLQPPRETQQALEQRRESKGESQVMPSLDSDGGTRRYEGLQGTRGFEVQVAPRYKWAALVDAVRQDISEIDGKGLQRQLDAECRNQSQIHFYPANQDSMGEGRE